VTFLTSARNARRWRWLRQAALVALALFVAHEAVYLVRYGDAAHTATLDASAGHAYWPAFLAIVGLSLVLLALRAGWRLTLGARQAAEAAPSSADPAAAASWAAEWRHLFARLAPVTASLFLLQENLEHLIGHGHVEGLAVYIGAGSELALPVVLAVVAGLAGLGALIRWQEAVIAARLRAGRLRHARPGASLPDAGWHVVAAIVRRLLLGDDVRGRAPPRLLSA
jgi:hypothetical protein